MGTDDDRNRKIEAGRKRLEKFRQSKSHGQNEDHKSKPLPSPFDAPRTSMNGSMNVSAALPFRPPKELAVPAGRPVALARNCFTAKVSQLHFFRDFISCTAPTGGSNVSGRGKNAQLQVARETNSIPEPEDRMEAPAAHDAVPYVADGVVFTSYPSTSLRTSRTQYSIVREEGMRVDAMMGEADGEDEKTIMIQSLRAMVDGLKRQIAFDVELLDAATTKQKEVEMQLAIVQANYVQVVSQVQNSLDNQLSPQIPNAETQLVSKTGFSFQDQSTQDLLKEKDELIGELNSKLSQNMERNADLAKRIEEMQRHIDQKHQETNTLKKQLKAMESKAEEDLQKRIVELQNQVQSMMQRDVDACHAIEELEYAKREIENLRRAQEVANSAIHRMQNELLQRSINVTDPKVTDLSTYQEELEDLRTKLRDYETLKISKDALEERIEIMENDQVLAMKLIAQIDSELAKMQSVLCSTDCIVLVKQMRFAGALDDVLSSVRSCQVDLSFMLRHDVSCMSKATEIASSGHIEGQICSSEGEQAARIISECKSFNSLMINRFLSAIELMESDIDELRLTAVPPIQACLQYWPEYDDINPENTQMEDSISRTRLPQDIGMIMRQVKDEMRAQIYLILKQVCEISRSIDNLVEENSFRQLWYQEMDNFQLDFTTKCYEVDGQIGDIHRNIGQIQNCIQVLKRPFDTENDEGAEDSKPNVIDTLANKPLIQLCGDRITQPKALHQYPNVIEPLQFIVSFCNDTFLQLSENKLCLQGLVDERDRLRETAHEYEESLKETEAVRKES
eukprot:748210-Hanusia_phi.AAC.1